MEVADPKWRTHIGIALFLPWALSLMAWGGFAYLVREWRMLQLTVSLLCLAFLPTLCRFSFYHPSSPTLLLLSSSSLLLSSSPPLTSSPPPSPLLDYPIRFMDESPRWLAVRGQHRRALRVLQRAARWNGVALPPEDELLLLLKDGTILILLLHHSPTPPHTLAPSPNRTPRLRTITLSLYTNYLLVGAVYFGLSLSGGDLSSDPFLYMVLTGVVELPAYTLVIPLVARYGRRAPVVAFFFMGAVALLALPFVPTGTGESMPLALMGKMSIASAFQILDFYSSELFPTEVRTRGMSTALVMPLVPVGAVSSVRAASVLAGLATLALPETLHVPLPDTIAHLEEREIRTSGFLRLPVRPGFQGIPLQPLRDSTPRGFTPSIPLQGIPLQGGDSTSHSRGFHSRGFHSQGDFADYEPECSYFVLNSSSGQVEEEPCVEWDFDNSTFSSTVGTEVIFDSDRLVSGVGACDLAVTKFQLACGWEYLRSTYQSIYMFGVTIGAPFNGVLADRYGRKMTVAVGFVAYSALAIGSCWIPNLSALLLSRFLMGAVHPTIQKTGYILGMEVADPKWRTHIGIVLFLPWALVSWRGAGSLTSSGNGGCFS
ncbi:putative organic cation transporter protein-like [Penaeus vannamei]|uniref:Putative organic cation transporter protein-like n=1 Tax=Penaeus vannamei TaxID=6689 RepID=A0A423TEI7_PENVA|nr:putative organic cation transporter protein-like [Penaeus vannamei]